MTLQSKVDRLREVVAFTFGWLGSDIHRDRYAELLRRLDQVLQETEWSPEDAS
jgi:hypothetical protein